MAGNSDSWRRRGRDAEPEMDKRPRLADQQGGGEAYETVNGPIKANGKGRKDIVIPGKAEWIGNASFLGRTGVDWSIVARDRKCYNDVYRPRWEDCDYSEGQHGYCEQLSCSKLTSDDLTLKRIGDFDPQTAALVRQYREEALQLAISLASGQLCSVWLYDFAYSHRTVHSIYRYMEVELLGAVPFLPLPDLFQTYLEDYGQFEQQDGKFLGFNRYPNTLVLPPGYMHLLNMTPNLTTWQLVTNHLAGCKLIQPCEWVFQVFGTAEHYAYLLSTPNGSCLYSDGECLPARMEILLPNLWFNEETKTESWIFPFPLTLEVVLTLIDKHILELIGEKSDGYIRKYDNIKAEIREKYCHSENCKALSQRLKALGTAYCPPSPQIPLPAIPYTPEYCLIPTPNTALRMLYVSTVKGLCYGTDCPLTTPLFRFAPALQNPLSPYIVTVLVNAKLNGGTLDQAAAAMAQDDYYFSAKPYAVFLFRWEAKLVQPARTSLQIWEALTKTLNLRDLTGKSELLEQHVPSSLTVLISVLDQGSQRAFEAAKSFPNRITRLFSHSKALDLWSLDDDGAVMNLFTAGNGQEIAEKYEVGSYVEEGSWPLFAEFRRQLHAGVEMQMKVEDVVREGVERRGLEGEDLLLYAERTLGSADLPVLVQIVTRYGRFTPVRPSPRPEFPQNLFPAKDLATMSDSQMVIWSFLTQLCTHQPVQRRLILCGPVDGDLPGFAYFLAKYFRVYWRAKRCPLSIPPRTELVVTEEWNMQPNDLSWAQSLPIPVVVLTTCDSAEVICRLNSSNRGGRGAVHWEVVALAGRRVSFGGAERVEELPRELVYPGMQGKR